MSRFNDRQKRDVERLSGRRGDKSQRAILWSELDQLARKLFQATKSKKLIADDILPYLDPKKLAESPALRAVNAFIDNTQKFIANEAKRLDASDAAIDTKVDEVSVRVDDAETAVSNEITARSDGDTALGQQITTVQATANAANATASQNASAIATIEGYQAATYTFRVDAGDAEGSLELVAADDPINGPRSAVRIEADNIILDGTILQAHIAEAAIGTAQIGDLAVDTIKLAGNSVTAMDFTQLASTISGDGTLQTAMTAFVSVPRLETVELLVVASFSQGYATTPKTWGFRIEDSRNGVILDRAGMNATNDYPSVSAITTWTNNTASDQNFIVLVKWQGQDSNIQLLANSTLSIFARWR